MKKTPELVTEAKRLREKGLSYAEIGEVLGAGWATIRRWSDTTAAEKDQEYRDRTKESRIKYDHEYYKINQESIAKYRGSRLTETREARREYNREYQLRNKSVIREYKRKYIKHQRLTNVNFRLGDALRSRLNKAIKGNQKGGSAVADLGCSIADLKRRLEFCFEPGMTWDNYGEWHIDHIRPLSKFDLIDQKQFLQANNFTNLQPMRAEDNLRKGASC